MSFLKRMLQNHFVASGIVFLTMQVKHSKTSSWYFWKRNLGRQLSLRLRCFAVQQTNDLSQWFGGGAVAQEHPGVT